MDDLEKETEELAKQVDQATDRLKVTDLTDELDKLKQLSVESDFWKNSHKAQGIMQQIASLESRLEPWLRLKSSVSDLLDMLKLKDNSLETELNQQLKTIKAQFNSLKEDLKFIGEYDNHNLILNIYAGAGGTDAQDWTQILFRMYSRYFEKNRWDAKVVDQTAGDEAGLKSVTMTVKGAFAYGKLKGEQGVHRLVRLSPFNADNLRQTSFAKVDVLPEIERPDEILIDDKDLKIDVFRSGGHGGQSVNTTDSAVRITHLPTAITVAIQNERSQLQNKETAMTILRSRLAKLEIEQHQEKLGELKGPNQSAEWGNQIRSYVLHPYKQVKDLRTGYESANPEAVLNGDLDGFIDAYLEQGLK